LKLYTKTKKNQTSSPSSKQDNSDISRSLTNLSITSQAFDKSFFNNQTPLPKIKGKFANEFNRVKLYSIHNKLGDDGKPIVGNKPPSDPSGVNDKKHHKKGRKNVKNRGAIGYDI
jgi:hypothetical protein